MGDVMFSELQMKHLVAGASSLKILTLATCAQNGDETLTCNYMGVAICCTNAK
jgi:hypothetical protein